MTDKEFLAVFLGRYQKALAKIAELEQLKQRIESEAVSIKGVNITTDKVQSNKHTDNVAAPVVSAVSVGEKIADLQSKLPALMNNTDRVINMLPFEFQGRTVLEAHFIFGYPLATAHSFLGISRNQVYVQYNKALELLLKLPEVREILEWYANRLRENKRRRMVKSQSSGEASRE